MIGGRSTFLFRAQRVDVSLVRDEQGQSMAEFSIIAITFFFVLLGVIQLAMVLNAFSLVRYAAYNAARAAIVHSGDPQKMAKAARLSLVATFPRHGRADHRRGFVENYRGAELTDSDRNLTYYGRPITSVSIVDSGDVPCETTVTFDDPVDSDNAHITVQVVHQYEMVIPLVNRLIFYVYELLESGPGYRGETPDYVAKETDRLRRTGRYRDIEYRIPLVAHYTMRAQSDFVTGACPPTPTPTNTPTPMPPTPTPTPPPVYSWVPSCAGRCHERFTNPHTCTRCHLPSGLPPGFWPN